MCSPEIQIVFFLTFGYNLHVDTFRKLSHWQTHVDMDIVWFERQTVLLDFWRVAGHDLSQVAKDSMSAA